MTSPSLKLFLLGPFAAELDGVALPPPRLKKSLWLLALLALRQGREVPREWLAETLWPDSEPAIARANLRHALANDLRPALGTAAASLRAPSPTTLRFDLNTVWVDVLAFDAAIAEGGVSALQQALALYRGPLLEGCTEEWALVERTSREEAFHTTLERLAKEAMAGRQPSEAASYLRRLLASSPLRERAYATLMEALWMSGDAAGVKQVYRDLRLLLHRELHAEPHPDTTALYNRLKQAQPSALPQSAPSLSDFSAFPRRLPVPLTRLIGREGDIADVVDRFTQGRLVTLVGAGGVGKTRLALAVAESLADNFLDGVWFVELASLGDGAHVASAVARTLQVSEERDRGIVETLARTLASTALLLVLDNCEHLLDACAQLAEALLSRCPHLQILVTSRQALGVTGEWIYRVPSLTTPPHFDVEGEAQADKNLVSRLMEYEEVRLFVERAAAQSRPLPMTPPQCLMVAEICRCLDGIPLAIEMAAARTRTLSLEAIRSRLTDRFALLGGSSRTALPRQQTLKALLDWSYDLLTSPEQTLLNCLSVFSGGWTLEAAEQVCGEGSDDVLNLLTSLVDKSLVLYEEANGEGRYAMLETVRQYAAQRLQESEAAAAVRDKHRDFCLALAEEAKPKLYGPEQATWLNRLDIEHDNLLAALNGCELDTSGAVAGLRLCGALSIFWVKRGYLRLGREYLGRALAREEGRTVVGERATALSHAGYMALQQGDYVAGQALYEELRAIGQESGDPRHTGSALSGLSQVFMRQGDYGTARTLTEENLAISRKIGDRYNLGIALTLLGALANYQADYPGARTFFEESLAISREFGNQSEIAGQLNNLGLVAQNEGDYRAAQTLFEEAMSLCRALGHKQFLANVLANLGILAMHQSDHVAARSLYDESLAIGRELGNRHFVAGTLTNLGLLRLDQGESTTARADFQEALAIYEEIGDKSGIAGSIANIASVARYEGDYTAARSLYEQALAALRELGHKEYISNVLRHLGMIAEHEQDYVTAQALYSESLTLGGENRSISVIALGLEGLASALLGQGEAEEATRLWSAAHALRETAHLVRPSYEHEGYDRRVEQARLALGDASFAIAWDEGHALTLEEALLYALSDHPPIQVPPLDRGSAPNYAEGGGA